MLERDRFTLLLVFLTSLHRQARSCEQITDTSVFPTSITLFTSYAEIRCEHDTPLDFVSFYLPSGVTLTTSNLPKHLIVDRENHATLVVNDIAPEDIGQYQCNFRDQHDNQCFEQIDLQLDVDFCTPNSVTYHRYAGESVTLECCVNNHASQYWKRDGSEDPISGSDNVQLIGTSLKISSLSLEDEGTYICVAVDGVGEEETLAADLKVYERLSISVEPQQKVVNASDRAELTCMASSYPPPTIVWTREVSTELQLQAGVIEDKQVAINSTTIQSVLTFFSVSDEVTGTYHCTGVNGNGSLTAVASLQLFGTPSPPLDVTLSIANQTNVNVTWKPPLDDGHLQLLGYSVMWFRMGANGSILDRDSHQVDSLFTNYIIEDLLPVTNYSVTIYAINGRGRGKGSDEQDILTFPSVPGAPTQVDSSQLTSSSVHIEFTIPTDTGGLPITRLRITYQPGRDDKNTSSENFLLPDAIPLQKRSQKLEGLKGDTAYTARVSVGNAIGFGKERVALFRTLRPGYPATPTSVRASLPGEIGATSVRLSWNVLDVGEPSVGYEIRAVEEGATEEDGKLFILKPEDVQVDGTTESAKVSPLDPGTCYTFTVTMTSREAVGFTSRPSNITCTLSCPKQSQCGDIAGIMDKENSNAKLVPILAVTIVVAIVVLLTVVLVAVLSRRYSKRRKSSMNLFSHDQSFTASSSSSQFGVDRSASSLVSSSLNYNHQISQNSSSAADFEEAPTTSSSTVSDNPFNFGTPHSQTGSPQYQNRPHHYENGTESVSNLSVACPQQLQVTVIGAKTIGSYPLFPIPEHTVAMGGHFENSAPEIPIRAQQLQRDGMVMTENPAFKKPHHSIPIASHPNGVPHTPEDTTPPPVPPPTYRRGSHPEVVVGPAPHHSPPPQHIHVHTTHQHTTGLPASYSSAPSLPLGESFSLASRSPAMPRTAEFFLPPDGEEDEVEFTDNDAYESASPQPLCRDLPLPNPSPSSSSTLPQSYSNLSVASFPRGQSASPVLPRRQEERRGSSQSTGSGVNEGPPPRFEISRQEERSSSRERGGRGAVFETVTIRSHV